jgi:hypothetical protein
MLAILHLLGTSVANLFKSPRRLEVENLFLRHQLDIALRGAPRTFKAPWERSRVIGMDDLAVAKAARFVARRSA